MQKLVSWNRRVIHALQSLIAVFLQISGRLERSCFSAWRARRHSRRTHRKNWRTSTKRTQIWRRSEFFENFFWNFNNKFCHFQGFPSAQRPNSRIFSSACFAATLKNECPLMFSSITRSYSDIRQLSNNKQQVKHIEKGSKSFGRKKLNKFPFSADLPPSPFTPSQKPNIAPNPNTAPPPPAPNNNNNNINNNLKLGEFLGEVLGKNGD